MSEDIEGKIDVPIADGVDIDEIRKNDKSPLFVTIEALNNSISDNKNNWTDVTIAEIAEQIMQFKPDAYKGHIRQEDRGSIAPSSQTIWLGALAKKMSGKTRLFIKGYVLPYANELREYLKTAKAVSKKISVSVYGKANKVWNDSVKAYDVSNFKLESIDWSRPGAEGVSPLGYMELTSEMKKGESMEREDILKEVTVSEMKEANAKLVGEIEESAKESVVKEMTEQLDEIKGTVKSYENALPKGVEKNPEVIQEMVVNNNVLAESYLNGYVDSKVKFDGVAKIVKRQVIAEMADKFKTKELVEKTVDGVLDSAEMKTIVQEMENSTTVNPGVDNRADEKVNKYISK